MPLRELLGLLQSSGVRPSLGRAVASRGLLAVRGLPVLVGLLMRLLLGRLLVGLLWRRSTLRRRFASPSVGSPVTLFLLVGLDLLLGELLRGVGLPGMTRRMARFPAVLEAVAVPPGHLLALLGPSASPDVSHGLSSALALLAGLSWCGLALTRLLSLARLSSLARLLSLPRLLSLTRLLVTVRRLPTVPTLRGPRSGHLLPGDVVAFVSRLAAVSETGPVLVVSESLRLASTALGVVPGRNRDVLPL